MFLEKGRPSVLFGARLEELAIITRSVWGLSSQEILDRHTAMPFYGRFLPRDRLSKCLEILKFGARVRIPTMLGLHNQSHVIYPIHLRFCRSCALDDIAAFGETFWRRSHQLSGAIVCTRHAEVLKLSTAAMFTRRPLTPQDATNVIDLESVNDCAVLTAREQSLAERVSVRCVAFLRGTPTVWEYADLRSQYRESAKALNHLRDTRNPKNLSRKKLKYEFSEFYGREFLKKIGCNCNFESGSPWIVEIFQLSTRHLFQPLLHALVQIFLEAMGEGRESSANEITYKQLGWKCPNRYAVHDDHFRIPAVERRWRKGREYLSARCSCGYGFTFRAGSTADPMLPEVTHVFAWGIYCEREAKRLRDDGLAAQAIASRMGISREVVRRLIQGKKSSFEHTEREIHSWRKRWLKSRSRTLRWRLKRYDRAWLAAQGRRSGRGNGRPKDWTGLDKTFAPLLRSAVKGLKAKFPGRRISYAALEEETGIKSLKKKARKLPICSTILSKALGPQR
jgi:Tn7-like transposition protein D/TniQ